MSTHDDRRTALVIGASRGLGLAIAAELADRGWEVIGTVRATSGRSGLHELAERSPGRVRVEHLDVTEPAQLAPLRERLAGRELDLLFVNAGTTRDDDLPIGEVSTEAFVEVMVTNALSPLRVIETLDDLVAPSGVVGAMSSGQGSITDNETAGHEVYRGSKAALNMLVRSYAARHRDSTRSVVLLAPGWIQTDLGGPDARFTVAEAVPQVVDVLESRLGVPGLAYLDRFGRAVAW